MNEGSLYKKLKQKKLSEKQASSNISDICSGVAELHKNDIIHRDIKSENICICMGVCKICDFGSSAV